jgi:general secretion pathway protein D
LTPYIVRKSGDLQKLKEMLSELEEVQIRYNSLVEHALEENKNRKQTTMYNGEGSIISTPHNSSSNNRYLNNLDILQSAEEQF